MELVLERTVYRLKKGDALRYHANKRHIYRNPFGSRAVFHNLIHYMKG